MCERGESNIAFAIREALLSLSNFTDDSKILLHSFYLRNLTSSNSIHRLIKVGKNLLNQPRLIFTHKYTHTCVKPLHNPVNKTENCLDIGDAERFIRDSARSSQIGAE